MAGALANLPPDIVEKEVERGKILVVDDEPDIRESLEFLLSNEIGGMEDPGRTAKRPRIEPSTPCIVERD